MSVLRTSIWLALAMPITIRAAPDGICIAVPVAPRRYSMVVPVLLTMSSDAHACEANAVQLVPVAAVVAARMVTELELGTVAWSRPSVVVRRSLGVSVLSRPDMTL